MNPLLPRRPSRTTPRPRHRPDALAELLRRIADGDAGACSHFVRRAAAMVRQTVRRYAAGADCDDTCADVLSAVWRRAHTFRPERGRAATWVRLLARSRSIDAVRARRARRTETLATDPATSSADPAVRGELRDAVRHALATLRPEERAVVEHSVYGGLSQAETAAALALPLGTVKTRTRRAHGRLRAMLRTHCPD